MKTAVIIGAGPAGLTAAYELLTKTDIKPIIIEADQQAGGLSKTIDYKGNKIDIGGHRFFSKSKKVIDWWLQFLPLDPEYKDEKLRLRYQNRDAEYISNKKSSSDPDKIMLIRKRKSRIFYQKKFFDYPLR
ncbi:MAG: NAD(P)-binding protein, partial [Bacteroidetes bacterium]|nr:NAD(P)-binding protein [Bacteroidota bacterium]